MNAKKIYGPKMPPMDDLSTNDYVPNDLEASIEQYKNEMAVCETIGPLLPGCELLEDVRHIRKITEVDHVKPNANIWLTEMLPPSKIDPIKNLKSRGFSMDSRSYLNFNTENLSKPDSRESLMDIHKRHISLNVDDENTEFKVISSSNISCNEKKSKNKKRKSHSPEERKRKKKSKKKKSKRHCNDEDSEEKEKKSKKPKQDNVNPVNATYKWCPFSANSTRKAFNPEIEMKSSGCMTNKAKADVMKQAYNMYSDFVVASKK